MTKISTKNIKAVTATVCLLIVGCILAYLYTGHKQEQELTLKTCQKLEVVSTLTDEQKTTVKKKLSTAKYDGTVLTSRQDLDTTIKREQTFRKADTAIVVESPNDKLKLKQYNIYAYPKIQKELGLKLDAEKKVSGISYGVKKRISDKGKYIGVRLDYDWKEKKAGTWLTYSW